MVGIKLVIIYKKLQYFVLKPMCTAHKLQIVLHKTTDRSYYTKLQIILHICLLNHTQHYMHICTTHTQAM